MTTRLPAVQFHEIWYRKTSVVGRIRIDYAVLNPDPYWECESGEWKPTKINLILSLSKRLLGLVYYLLWRIVDSI
jgi:hypothetical protein